MATTSNDLKIYYSGATAAGGVQDNPLKSLDGFRSAVIVPNSRVDNLFDSVGMLETKDGQETCYCVILKNNHITDAIENLNLYISGKQTFETIKFGVSIPAVTDGEVQLMASPYELPYNVDFYEAYTVGTKLTLIASLTAGKTIALWLNRIIATTESQMIHGELSLVFDWT